MKLTNPTDDDRNAAFAEHIAKRENVHRHPQGHWLSGYAGCYMAIEDYVNSMDEVAPWLEASPFDVVVTYSNTCCMWTVRLQGRFTSNREFVGEDVMPAGAAVNALLKSAGVEIEFTK